MQVDEDKVGVILDGSVTGNYYGELDFTQDGSHDFTKEHLYEYVIRPLPVINVNADDFSVTHDKAIHSFILGFRGNPTFNFEIIDELEGTNIKHYFKKHSDKDAIDMDYMFEGQLWVNTLKSNGGKVPEIRITKKDGQHIEINSINLEMETV